MYFRMNISGVLVEGGDVFPIGHSGQSGGWRCVSNRTFWRICVSYDRSTFYVERGCRKPVIGNTYG